MGFEFAKNWFIVLLLVSSTLLCASARNTFVTSASEEERVEKPIRKLRTVYFLHDYDDPSANRGHDPGNRMGGDDGGGRPSRHRP